MPQLDQALEVSEIQVSYNPLKNPKKIRSITATYQMLKKIWDPQLITVIEQIYCLFLDKDMRVLCWKLLNTGDVSSCIINKKLLVSIACKTQAHYVIIAHNHPSGNLIPSKADKDLTSSLQSLLLLTDVLLLDHLIITNTGYFSFIEDGLLLENSVNSHKKETKIKETTVNMKSKIKELEKQNLSLRRMNMNLQDELKISFKVIETANFTIQNLVAFKKKINKFYAITN